jgi:hypothetical protein
LELSHAVCVYVSMTNESWKIGQKSLVKRNQ